MEVRLEPELQSKLAQLAAEQGRDVEALAREAIERLIDYDSWFTSEVEKGIAAADRGEFLSHADVAKLIEEKFSPLT